MKKELSEKTNEELWQLFPIILREYDTHWAERYLSERDAIIKAVGEGNITRINHIGSTAVPHLTAKPTIDILLEITAECDTEKMKNDLVSAGYIFSAQPGNPAPHMMFMKGYTPEGFKGQAFHLHVRYAGDWGELYFRDYILKHKDIADEYGRLKMGLWKKYEHDRDGYTDAKTEFIRKYTDMAREEFGGRYKIESLPQSASQTAPSSEGAK